jgi:hypothetical protein
MTSMLASGSWEDFKVLSEVLFIEGPGPCNETDLFNLSFLMLQCGPEGPSEGLMFVLHSGSGSEEILVCDITHALEFQDAKCTHFCFGG